MRKIVAMLVCLIMAFSAVACAENATTELQGMYAEAELLMAQGDYSGAASKFEALGAYSDASQMAMYCKAIAAAETLAMYDVAVMTFQQLGDFRDSKQMAAYYEARKNEAVGDSIDAESEVIMELSAAAALYEQAEKGYTELALFKDCMTRLADCQAKRAAVEKLIEERKAQAARDAEEREAQEKEDKYQSAISLENDGEFFKAIAIYDELGSGYKDCETRSDTLKEKLYLEAIEHFFAHEYRQAKESFDQLGEYKNADYPSSDILALFCERDIGLPQSLPILTILHHDVDFSSRVYAYKCLLHYLNSEGNSFGVLTEENYSRELAGNYIAFGQTSGNGPGSYIMGYKFDKRGNVYYGLAAYIKDIDDGEPEYNCSYENDMIALTSTKSDHAKSYYTVARLSKGYYAWFRDGDTGKAPEFFTARVDEEGKKLIYEFSTDPSAPYEELAEEPETEETGAVDPLQEYDDNKTIIAVQQALNNAGYNCGTPDGAAGRRTKLAISNYQTDKGLTVTGTATYETLVSLGIID